jgi:hypothetical protein
MKAKLGTKALSISLSLAMSSLLPGAAIAATTVEDLPSWQSGNAGFECSQIGEYTYALKIAEGAGEGAPNTTETYTSPEGDHTNTITISNSDGSTFDWSASGNKIGAVIVKAGTGAKVYKYDPQQQSDTALVAYQGREVSHITFCWNLDEEPVAQTWCSPGYWRQPHHLDSWEPTGYSPDDKYNDHISPALIGNPTLLQVLQSPQIYKGDAFNKVGDLLSAAHPDVNFLGERVADSCPLN